MPKPPLPKEKYKGRKITVRITEEEHEAWTWLAEYDGTTISRIWKQVVDKYFDREVYPKAAILSGFNDDKKAPNPKIPKDRKKQKAQKGAIYRLS
jgi:hypothetical protein